MIEQKPVRAPAPDLLERARSEAINWSATWGRLFDELADEIERLTDLVDAAGKQNMQHMELAKERRELAEAAEAELDDWRVRAIKAEENDRISREWLAAAEARADALAKELAETQERLHNRTEQLTATAKELAEAREERDALAAAIRLMRDDTAIRRG